MKNGLLISRVTFFIVVSAFTVFNAARSMGTQIQQTPAAPISQEVFNTLWQHRILTLEKVSPQNYIQLCQMLSSSSCMVLKGHENVGLELIFSPSDAELALKTNMQSTCIWNTIKGTRLWATHRQAQWLNKTQQDCALRGKIAVNSLELYTPHSSDPAFVLNGHTDVITCFAFNPAGTQIATGSIDKTARLWDRTTGSQSHILQNHAACINRLAYHPSGNQLATASAHTILLWNTLNGRLLHTMDGHTQDVVSIAYNKTGNFLASGSQDKTVRIWNSENGSLLHILNGHTAIVTDLAFNNAGDKLASSAHDLTVRLWNIGLLENFIHASKKLYIKEILLIDQICNNIAEGLSTSFNAQSAEARIFVRLPKAIHTYLQNHVEIL